MSYAATILSRPSLKAYYRLSEASGLIQDSSGLGHHAVSSGGTPVYQASSPISSDPSDFSITFGTAIHFDIPDHADLDFGDVMTAEAWVNRSSLSGPRVISGRGSGSLTWGLDSDDTIFIAKADFGVIVSSTITLSQNVWYHVVYTKNGATSKLYINGNDVTGTVTNLTLVNVTDDLVIAQDYALGFAWNGSLDEIAFYSTALSQAEVQENYAAAFLFPTTPILDDFTGADETPITTKWTAPLNSGDSAANRTSNQFSGGAGRFEAAYDLAQFGPDVEAYATIAVAPGSSEEVMVGCRYKDVGSAGPDGYYFRITGPSPCTCTLRRVDNGTSTTLATVGSQAIVNGDACGIAAIGDTLQGWLRQGGVWRKVLETTDATYSVAGYSMLSLIGTGPRFDDFGGGDINAIEHQSYFASRRRSWR